MYVCLIFWYFEYQIKKSKKPSLDCYKIVRNHNSLQQNVDSQMLHTWAKIQGKNPLWFWQKINKDKIKNIKRKYRFTDTGNSECRSSDSKVVRWVNLPIEGTPIAPFGGPLEDSENNTTPSPTTRRFVRWVNLPIENNPKMPLVNKGPRGSGNGTPIEEIITEGRSPHMSKSTTKLMTHTTQILLK